MNSKIQLSAKFAIVSIVVIFGFLGSFMPAKVSASGASATCDSATSATLNGHVETYGEPTEVWFKWWEPNGNQHETTHQIKYSDGSFSQKITGLSANTSYSFSAYAQNKYGTDEDGPKYFSTDTCSTSSPTAPTATLDAADSNQYSGTSISIQSGGSATIYWTSSYATSCVATGGDNFNTGNAISGHQILWPTSTTTYKVKCSGNGMYDEDSVTVNVASQQKPIVDFYAADSQNSTQNSPSNSLNILFDGSATIYWYSENATSCTGTNFSTGNTTHGSQTVWPTSSKTYTVNCTGGGGSTSKSLTINVGSEAKPVIDFYAADSTHSSTTNLVIEPNNSATIYWYATNANTCNRDWVSGWEMETHGSQTVWPTATKTYTITCTNSSGSSTSKSLIITVSAPAPACTLNISYNPTIVNYGGSLTVSYNGTNVASGTAEYNFDNKGYAPLSPFPDSKVQSNLINVGTHSIILRAKNSAGQTCYSNTASYTVNSQVAQPPAQNPSVDLSAYPTEVASGQGSTLSWTSVNATSCSAAWTASTNTSGSKMVYPQTTTTYHITCYGASGTTPATDSATVTVINLSGGQTCNDPSATNYHISYPCTYPPYPPQTCQDNTAINFGGSLPCRYNNPPQLCQDTNATNYGGSLPCQYQQTPAPTVNLSALPTSVSYGGTTNLSWTTTNATSCNASSLPATSWSGSKNTSGNNVPVSNLTTGTTFTLHCTGPGGFGQDSVFVSVGNQPENPSGNLTLSPQSCTIESGASTCTVNATWTTQNATSPKLVDRNTGNTLSTSANRSTPLSVWVAYPFTTFDLKNGSDVLDTETATANCASNTFWNGTYCQTNNVQTPSLIFTANPTSIDRGESSLLSWDSTNTTSCTASLGWSGAKSVDGTQSVSPSSTTTYTLTCFGSNGGQVTKSVTVDVDQDDNDNFDVSCRADDRTVETGERVRWIASTRGVDENLVDFDWSGDANGNDEEVDERYSREGTYRARVRAEWNGNVETASCEVEVEDDNDNISTARRPVITLSANPTVVNLGGSSYINWSVINNPTFCNASGGRTNEGWLGPKSTTGGNFRASNITGDVTYYLTCGNSAGSTTAQVTVSVIRPTIIQPPTTTRTTTVVRQVLGATTGPSSLVLLNSSVERNQAIVPTLDKTNPCPGDEITYTVNYQNVGTASVTNLNLQVILPAEVTYVFSSNTANVNPNLLGNTVVFSLGTLRGGGTGTVIIKVRVRDNIPAGTPLHFPAILSYVSGGQTQTVTANVSAQVCTPPVLVPLTNEQVRLGANVFSSGIWLPSSLLGWLLLLLLVLLLILLIKQVLTPKHPHPYALPAGPYPLPPASYPAHNYYAPPAQAAYPLPPSSYPKKTTTIVEH